MPQRAHVVKARTYQNGYSHYRPVLDTYTPNV